MKNFLKLVFANIVAILVIGMVLFGFLILTIVASAASGESKTTVQKNSILKLNIDGPVLETFTEAETDLFSFGEDKNLLLTDILYAIEKAKKDENIKGISIEIDDINAGITQVDDIRTALEDFKKSGKFIYAYGNNMSQKSFYLASVADQLFVNPVGMVELKGLSTEVTFLKDFADKYGIGIDVIRHGKFKAAVEPFLRNEISPENKEQLSTMLNDVWANISSKIIKSRRINAIDFKTSVDSLNGFIPELMVKNKLVNKLLQKSEYDNLLKSKINLKPDEELKTISTRRYINTLSEENDSDNQIAVLYASGEIFSGNEYSNIHSEKYISYIKEIADDENIKAVVLRVNSPGGSSNASDEILFELQQLKKKKPVIVSFGDYAASGGYYISMAADRIFSNPNTLTGSIGVFGVIANFKELANRNGIKSNIVSTNANSNIYSPLSGPDAATIPVLTKSVDLTYKRFVYFVSKNRKMTFDQVDAIGGGRVWSGTRAKELGLVDELGSLQQAINYAAKTSKLKDYSTISYPRKMTKFEEFFSSAEGDEIASKMISKQIGKENFELFQKMTQPKFQNGVQMALPYEIKIK